MKQVTPQFRDASDYILGAILLLIAFFVIIVGSRSAFNMVRVKTLQAYALLEQPLGSFKSYKSALTDNTRLRQQNVLLQDELNRLRAASKENERLRKLLDFNQQTELKLKPVLVIGKELTGIHNFLTISLNDTTLVRNGMPIINENGLVGQIIRTASGFAQVMPFYSNLFRVSAVIHGKTSSYGMVSWEGKSYNELVMNYVPATVPVNEGDLIVTSGYSDIYPPNIPIGYVQKIERNEGIETQKIFLKPTVSLFDLTEAFVVQHIPDSSRANLVKTYNSLFQ